MIKPLCHMPIAYRMSYACAALCHADSYAAPVIAVSAHAIACLHIRAGCLYSYAEHAAQSEVRAIARASCASSSGQAGYRPEGGGLPLTGISTSTGMHRLSRLARKVRAFEIGALWILGGAITGAVLAFCGTLSGKGLQS
jgi:hypothetical protein